MKKLRLACPIIAAVTLLSVAASCSSDPTTIGFKDLVDKYSDKATIILNLSAAATRAEDNLATDAEKNISSVNIFVFDENNKLEVVKSGIEVNDYKTVAIPLESRGYKTVYAVSANQVVGGLSEGVSTISDFENSTFSTSLSSLKNSDNEIVMIGKSDKQMVMASASGSDIPASNVFSIEMKRVLAKTQVKCAADASDASVVADNVVGINFEMGIPQYKVCQTNNTMRVVYNESLIQAFSNHTNGTYEGYTRSSSDTYTAQTSDFSAENCAYVPENIIYEPKCGNITFLSLKFQAKPGQFYTYSNDKLEQTSAPDASSDGTFYAVGIVDAASGLVDYAVTPNGENHDIVVFKTEEEANAYNTALNGGSSPVVTVSETDSPLRAPSMGTRAQSGFEVMKFDGGNVYYRVNLKGTDGKNSVERNNFYKVDIINVKSLGVNSESLLYPTEPTTEPDMTPSTSIQVKFTVTPWVEVLQNAVL